jgi:hypothetical protein
MAVHGLDSPRPYVKDITDERCRMALVPALPVVPGGEKGSECHLGIDIRAFGQLGPVLEHIERLDTGGASVPDERAAVERRLRRKAREHHGR